MKERVLVTGAAGFIGSNLTKRLVELGYDVTAVDNLYLGSKGNLEGLLDEVDFQQVDIMDGEALKRLFGKKFLYVFHHAACSSAPMFNNDPTHAMNVNTAGFMNMLQAAKESGVKRMVYASTSSIYHDLKPPHREDMAVIPASFYTISKYFDELAARQYWDEHRLETVGLRYFSVYGPNELHKGRFANIVSQFLWRIKKGESPLIYGDGEQARDFVYVDDVVEANLLAVKNGSPGEVYNVGSGVSKSFNEVIALINKLLEKDVKPTYEKNPVHNYIAYTMADVEKARKELKFSCRYDLEEGIRLLIDFYK